MSNPLHYLNNKQYTKTTFSETLKVVIPSLYFEEDNKLKNSEVDIFDQIINTHLNVIDNASIILDISGVSGAIYSGINSSSGIAQFFVKQNNLTDIDSSDFERNILIPLDRSLSDFESSSTFSEFIQDTLLPGIVLNSPTLDFVGGSASANHIYLISNLSWLYFLNVSGASYSPSTFVHDIIVSKLYAGGAVLLSDCMEGLTEHLWKNSSTFSQYSVIPEDFVQSNQDSTTTGTQQLDKLKTLVEILYSPLYLDINDTRVKDAIDDYLVNGYLLTATKLNGPFVKLVKAFSFAFADYSNSVDNLEILNNLSICPDELLPYLSDVIGWKLFGSEPERWRLQLANAVDVYRATGTKKSIQFAVDAVLGQDVFNVSSQVSELWESYIPFLIYYSLATESTMLKSFNTWNRSIAQNFGITAYSTSSMDDNIKLCVDQIIYEIVQVYRTAFLFNGKPFPIGSVDFVFNYRGRDFLIPPFEEYPYYLQTTISNEMIDTIADKLVCYGVPQTFAIQVSDYIRYNIYQRTDDTALKSGWLFFTSGSTYAPNWNSTIQDISNNRVEYLSLWNGKSSHFKVLLDASSFDFNKTSLEADSRETIRIVGQAAKEFSPADAIPDIIARLAEEDTYNNSQLVDFKYLSYPTKDAHLLYTSGAGLSRYGASALVMNTYKRGLNSQPTFNRENADSIIDSLTSPSSTTGNLPRRAHRRRNLKNLLPTTELFYTYDGFNTPVHWIDFNPGNQFYMPLGFIPSSLKYTPVPDHNNIPAVYSICENLNSSSVYNGVATSSTYPLQGWTPLYEDWININRNSW